MTDSADEPAAPRAGARDDATHVALLGPPHVRTPDGRRIALERRDAAMLAWLAVNGETARTRLLELLWPDSDAETARNNLRQRLFQLKKRSGVELVRGTEVVSIGRGIAIDLRDDPGGSATEIADADPAGQALLDGCDYADCAAFADWLTGQRERLAQARRDTLIAQAEAAEREGRLADALRLAESLIALDPLQEHAFRRLMRLHYLRGDRAAALAAFDRCERVLKDELSATPGAETKALLATIERSGAVAAGTRRTPLPATILRPPRLIGRDRDLEAMREAWDAGRVFLVTGEAGMGKTRLLAEFAAGNSGALHVQARPGDSGIPYASMARLLRALLERVPAAADAGSRAELSRVLPELGDRTPLPPGRVDLLQQAIESVLRVAFDHGIRALLLDDLHFADVASVDLVLALSAAEGEPTQRWGLAQRPAETTAAADAMRDSLQEGGRLSIVALEPLDQQQIAELVDSLELPGLTGAALGALLWQRTGGNPLFVLETLKHLGERTAGAKLPRPIAVGQLIERRLRQLSPQALALVRLAAVAGIDFSVPLAEELLGVRALEIADAWLELEAAHVFRGDAFAHDLVYETALASLPQAVAQRLHEQIAAWLEARGGDVEHIAQHWTRALCAERAVPTLRAAAKAALDKFQRPTAAQHLERAVAFLEELHRQDEAFDVQLEIVLLLQAFDAGPRHDAALEKLLALASQPAQRAQAHLAFAVLYHLRAHTADVLAALERAEADSAPESREMIEVLNIRGTTLRRLGRIDEALQAHRASTALARRIDAVDDLPAVVNNLALALLEANDATQAASAFDEAARLQRDPMTRARVLNNLAIALEESGQPEAALDTRQSALALLRGHDGSEFARANVLISLGSNARILQRFDAALEWLAQADGPGLPAAHWRRSNLHYQRALVWIELGAWSLADEQIDLAQAAVGGNEDAQLAVDFVLMRYQLARGMDATRTAQALDAQIRDRTDRRILRPVVVRRIAVLPPAEAIEFAQRELDFEAACGNRAAQVGFAAMLAQAELARGDAVAALAAARRANESMRTATPNLLQPLEVRLTLYDALQANGDPEAGTLLERLHAELMQIADGPVPPEHRHTFLNGVRMNRRIVEAWKARSALAGGRRVIPLG